MKQILAVALLLLSLASVAMADGGGQKPPVNRTLTNPPSVAAIQLADGGGGPVIKGTKAPQGTMVG
jgi:hypothetical protein